MKQHKMDHNKKKKIFLKILAHLKEDCVKEEFCHPSPSPQESTGMSRGAMAGEERSKGRRSAQGDSDFLSWPDAQTLGTPAILCW